MLKIGSRLTLFLLTGILALGFSVTDAKAEELVIDNLNESRVGGFPKDWKTYPFHKNKSRRVYKVQESAGKKYIQAIDNKNISVPIIKDIQWNVQKYPYLKFQWRAQALPSGAKEVADETNDSACGVYIGFSRTRAMKYVWSDGMTPGSYWVKKPGKFVIASREMGPANKGQWQTVTVNVPKEFQKYFAKPLTKNPIGIGLMTDGNAVKKPAACDYRDFRIASVP